MSKKNFYLGGILILLIAASILYKGPFIKWKNGSNKPKNFLAGINADSIDKIEIVKAGKTVVLEKQGDNWKIAGEKNFSVSTKTAADLKNGLGEMAKAELDLASSNKEKKIDYKTDDSGTKIKLMNGNYIAAEFTVGNRSNDFVNVYISQANSKNTYKIAYDVYNLFNKDEWRDMSIFSLDQTKINKIRFQYPDREFTAEKKDGKWAITVPRKMNVSQEKIQNVLSEFAALRAEKIPEQKFSGTGLEKHNLIVQVSGDGIDVTLMIGDKSKDGFYYVKKGDSDNIYLISGAARDDLNKKMEDLK